MCEYTREQVETWLNKVFMPSVPGWIDKLSCKVGSTYYCKVYNEQWVDETNENNLVVVFQYQHNHGHFLEIKRVIPDNVVDKMEGLSEKLAGFIIYLLLKTQEQTPVSQCCKGPTKWVDLGIGPGASQCLICTVCKEKV